MIKRIFFLVLIIINTPVYGQFHTSLSRSELGFMIGGSYYIGDLNRFAHFRNTQLAGGLVYRYNINSRVSFRANFTYGSVVGDDSQAKSALLKNRNLSFRSDIFELGAGVEFNYFPFQLGHDRYKGTAYVLAEIGMFKMNPQTRYNDEWVDLQPLGTEGQGSALSSKGKYPLYQVCIPLGVGVKISLGKAASINFEYGIRKTFTDYLDDVKSDSFITSADLSEANGPLAASLANKSIDGNQYGKRGTSATKDWYSFFGMSLLFRLGKPEKCFHGF